MTITDATTTTSRPGRADAARAGLALALSLAQPLSTRVSRISSGADEEDRARATEGAVTPAGGAFAIWGPLFASSIAYATNAAFHRDSTEPARAPTDWLMTGTFAANILWALNAQFRRLDWASVALIGSAAGTSAAALLRAERAARDDSAWRSSALTIGPLAGWLGVATFANVDTTLNLGRGRRAVARHTRRSVALIGAAAAVSSTVSWCAGGNIPHALATCWGLGGIALKARRNRNTPIAVTALGGVAAVGGSALAARRDGQGDRSIA